MQMMPSCDQTGVPIHFHSSTTSGSASLISLRILARVLPRQSPSSAIRLRDELRCRLALARVRLFHVLILKVQIDVSCTTRKIFTEDVTNLTTPVRVRERRVGAVGSSVVLIHRRCRRHPAR